MIGSRSTLSQALAVSLVLHALLLFALGPRLGARAPARPDPVTVLAARLEAVPERSPVKPAAPPEVLKNTLDPPQAKPLEDPIKPRSGGARRRRTSCATLPKTDALPPRPAPSEPTARAEPLGRGLDLRMPEQRRAERLNSEQLRETLGRLS
jgi:hypothetical protein